MPWHWRLAILVVGSLAIAMLAESLMVAEKKRLGYAQRLYPIWVYILISGWVTAFAPHDLGPTFTLAQHWGTQTSAAQAFALAIVLPLTIFLMPPNYFARWQSVLNLFALADIVLVTVQGWGFFNAHSFDAAMLACFIPFLTVWTAMLAVICIFVAKGRTAILVLAAGLFAVGLMKRRLRAALAIAALFLLLGYLAYGPHVFESGSRVGAWQKALGYLFSSPARVPFGLGLGSFESIGPRLGQVSQEYFMQLHNDWLQLVFELGIVGSALAAISYAGMLRLAWVSRNAASFSALIALGVCAITYYPLHCFWSELFLLCVLRETISGYAKNISTGR